MAVTAPNTLVENSLKRTLDMFAKDACLPAPEHVASQRAKILCKISREYSRVAAAAATPKVHDAAATQASDVVRVVGGRMVEAANGTSGIIPFFCGAL